MKKRDFIIVLFMLAISISIRAQEKPKLILQITVDQLRADLPMTVYDRLPEGGFKYLYENGIVYHNAHHRHANTETVVGHATLATGADPSEHGMIANLWFDKETNHTVYNVEDGRYPLIGDNSGVNKDNELDPTQAAAGTDGRSPSAMISTTFSDELALFSHKKSKVFGISVKDRAAITMAGHAGKAFWFSKASGDFISSTYYYNEYPDWVNKWNKQKKYLEYANTNWELTHDIKSYDFGEMDDMEYETSLPGFGRVFPHAYGSSDNPYFTTFLTLSPAGDELTLEFAKSLIQEEQIGTDEITDYLSVSFSSTDYVGHVFSPSSLESEDNLFKLDRTLAALLKYIDETVGLQNTLIAFSADHGGPDAPGYLEKYGIDAGYFDINSIDTLAIGEAIFNKFGIQEKIVSGYFHPYVYLNKDLIETNKLDINEVSQFLANELQKQQGIAFAVASYDLTKGNLANTALNLSILRNYNVKRSGEIYLVTEPYWYINDFDGLEVASTHGSPWEYDKIVPIIFIGNGLPAKNIYRQVETVDIALTLSNYLKIKAPSAASGKPLIEVLEK